MRKVLSVFLTLLALLALCVPARADILWEPYGNIFYEKHFGSCDYIGRDYYANGAEGFVTLWDAPGGSAVQSPFGHLRALSRDQTTQDRRAHHCRPNQ